MKGLICFLFSLFFFNSSNFAQKSNTKITEQDYYDFYNSISEPDSLKTYYLANEANNYSSIKGPMPFAPQFFFDTVFNKSDTNFLISQYERKTKYKWLDGKIQRAKILNIHVFFKSDNIEKNWDRFNKKYGMDGFWTFSIPYFSKDKNICMIIMENYCGSLCGGCEADYYKWDGSKWKLVATIRLWVS